MKYTRDQIEEHCEGLADLSTPVMKEMLRQLLAENDALRKNVDRKNTIPDVNFTSSGFHFSALQKIWQEAGSSVGMESLSDKVDTFAANLTRLMANKISVDEADGLRLEWVCHHLKKEHLHSIGVFCAEYDDPRLAIDKARGLHATSDAARKESKE